MAEDKEEKTGPLAKKDVQQVKVRRVFHTGGTVRSLNCHCVVEPVPDWMAEILFQEMAGLRESVLNRVPLKHPETEATMTHDLIELTKLARGRDKQPRRKKGDQHG